MHASRCFLCFLKGSDNSKSKYMMTGSQISSLYQLRFTSVMSDFRIVMLSFVFSLRSINQTTEEKRPKKIL
jgi:hypothetical protein